MLKPEKPFTRYEGTLFRKKNNNGRRITVVHWTIEMDESVRGLQNGKSVGHAKRTFYVGHGLPGRISLLIKDEAEHMHRNWELELHPHEARILGYALLMAAERDKPK